jgi:hypothetical protein
LFASGSYQISGGKQDWTGKLATGKGVKDIVRKIFLVFP